MKRILLVLLASMCLVLPSEAAQVTVSKLKNHLTVTGNLVVTGTSTHTGAVTNTGTVTNSGNVAVGGTLGVTGAVTLTTPLTAANIQTGSAKRQTIRALLAPNTSTAANATVYSQSLFFGRAGIVKAVTYATEVDPISGTNTIKVLKASSVGNTMLNAASVSLNGATANTGQVATLTATGADLAVTATQSVYCEYSAGTQGAAAKGVCVTVEFEPTDF